jgi:hypothetical protein
MNNSTGSTNARLHTLPEVYTVTVPRPDQENPDDGEDLASDALILHAHVAGDPFSTVSLPKKRPLLWPKQPQ